MGLFKSKKRTSVETQTKKVTLSKIVKLTYLQSLALDGGITTAGEVGGESQGRTTELTPTQLGTGGTPIEQIASSIESKFPGVSLSFIRGMFGDFGPGLSHVAESLFGSSRTVDSSVSVKESGWSVTKVWNQPQFDIIRYAIGIKELTVAQFTYEPVSEVISIPWKSPKEIIKTVLTVDQFIPGIFPPGNYITYYIKPNIENADWVQINPLGLPSIFREDGSIVPRIINFNTERPLSSQLEENYIITDTPVREVIFRAVITRPSELEGTTASADGYSPILRSYRLSMFPRNGL